MQKLEDFLYDFIGIFIPGFVLAALLTGTTIFFLRIEDFNWIYQLIVSQSTLISQPSYPLIQFIFKHNVIMYLLLLVICYVLGSLLSHWSARHIKFKDAKFRKQTKNKVVYDENVHILSEVEKELVERYNIKNEVFKDESTDAESIKRNNWIIYFRWANSLSGTEDRTNLQILLSKMIMIRSLFLASLLVMVYGTILIFVSSDWVIRLFLFVHIVVFWVLSRFFEKEFYAKKVILSNASVIMLHKLFVDKKKPDITA